MLCPLCQVERRALCGFVVGVVVGVVGTVKLKGGAGKHEPVHIETSGGAELCPRVDGARWCSRGS